MSIRPVDFNGMIQNTHEVSQAKANEDNKANLQQQNVQGRGHARGAECQFYGATDGKIPAA